MSVKWKESRGKYEVRWHEGSGQRSRLFERKGDADAFDLEIKRRRQLGALAPSVLQSRMTLAEFVAEDWWPRYAIPNLAEDTRRRYLELWGTHLLPRLGDYELRAFTSLLVEDFRDQLTRSRVPSQTVRQSLMLLQGILRRAVVRGLIPVNPVRDVPKPRQKPPPAPQPLPPLVVERIREYMLTTSWSSPGRGAGRSREQLRWWRHRGGGGDPPGARAAGLGERCDRCATGESPVTRAARVFPANPVVGDAGLEPATSALSRRRSPS
jgi:hypothetical protein